MRLKSFVAATMIEAMGLVREDFGDDAVIVSTRRAGRGRGVRITAALDDGDAADVTPADHHEPRGAATPDRAIRNALEYHRAPNRLVDRLIDAAPECGGGDPVQTLASALSASFGFEPLPERGGGPPLALVGPPGAGKTLTIAKMAARAVLAQYPVKLITTDGFRAGGVGQLIALTNVLGVKLHTAGSPRELAKVVSSGDDGRLVLIDTAGVNPFSSAEVVRLADLVSSVGSAPVLTLAAGADAADAEEIGEVFGGIGARRQIITRLDAARRLGAPLAAAGGGGLAFSDVSSSPHASCGLHPLDSASLARLLLSHAAQSVPAGGAEAPLR